MLRSNFLAGTLTLLVAGCSGNHIPSATLWAMQHPDRYELLSLDPSRPRTAPPPGSFHGWRVLGRAAVDDVATRERLNIALRAAARENSSVAAACFNPRHGIHIVRGQKIYDLVICFECLQVESFEDGKATKGFLVSESPQAAFDEVLRKAHVRLADKSH